MCTKTVEKQHKRYVFILFLSFFNVFFHFLYKKCNNYKNNCIFAKYITTNVTYRF